MRSGKMSDANAPLQCLSHTHQLNTK